MGRWKSGKVPATAITLAIGDEIISFPLNTKEKCCLTKIEVDERIRRARDYFSKHIVTPIKTEICSSRLEFANQITYEDTNLNQEKSFQEVFKDIENSFISQNSNETEFPLMLEDYQPFEISSSVSSEFIDILTDNFEFEIMGNFDEPLFESC